MPIPYRAGTKEAGRSREESHLLEEFYLYCPDGDGKNRMATEEEKRATLQYIAEKATFDERNVSFNKDGGNNDIYFSTGETQIADLNIRTP